MQDRDNLELHSNRKGSVEKDGGLMIALIDSPKCSPGAGLFMIQNWVAGQRRLAIPAPIPTPASRHQHGGQIQQMLPICPCFQVSSTVGVTVELN